MGGFKLGKMTLSSIFKKPETTLYPLEQKFVPKGLKGIVDNDVERCILCGICAKRCPCDAIQTDKKARMWSIDRFQCVQCGTCVAECPKNCLFMDPSRPQVATKKSRTVLEVPDNKARPNTKGDVKADEGGQTAANVTESATDTPAPVQEEETPSEQPA